MAAGSSQTGTQPQYGGLVFCPPLLCLVKAKALLFTAKTVVYRQHGLQNGRLGKHCCIECLAYSGFLVSDVHSFVSSLESLFLSQPTDLLRTQCWRGQSKTAEAASTESRGSVVQVKMCRDGSQQCTAGA